MHLFARRPAIAAVPISRSRGYPGAYDNYHALPDAARWHQAIRFRPFGSTPTADAIERVSGVFEFPSASCRRHGCGARGGRPDRRAGGRRGRFACDFAIAGTGYFVDPASRPELADFARHILLWRDRFTPPPAKKTTTSAPIPISAPATNIWKRFRAKLLT